MTGLEANTSASESLFAAPAPVLPQFVTAMMAAPTGKARAVIAGSNSVSTLAMIAKADRAGLIDPVLVGPRAATDAAAGQANVDINGFTRIEAQGGQAIAEASARAAKEQGADLAIKGQIHTDAYLRAFLSRAAGFRREGAFASHIFVLTAPDMQRPLMISDAAFNIAPDIDQRLAIATNAIEAAFKLGVEKPTIAILSASEQASAAMPSSVEAAQLAERLDGAYGSRIRCLAPVGFDLAVSPAAARIKGYRVSGGGCADVILVPSIETGNALFKALVYGVGACAAGVVLGLDLPLVLTSRADPAVARLASVALAARLADRS